MGDVPQLRIAIGANPPQISLIISKEGLKILDIAGLLGLASELHSFQTIKVVIDLLASLQRGPALCKPL
jgi:hypothetical protein